MRAAPGCEKYALRYVSVTSSAAALLPAYGSAPPRRASSPYPPGCGRSAYTLSLVTTTTCSTVSQRRTASSRCTVPITFVAYVSTGSA